jgi:hypothetical protein
MNDCLWPHDRQRIQRARKQVIEQRKNEPVTILERRSCRALAPQHDELVSQRQHFGFQRCPRLEQPDQREPEQLADINHQLGISSDSRLPADQLGLR